MAQLVPLELDDGAIIYLEANNDICSSKASEVDYSTYVGGKAGIPYVTQGTAKSNLKVKVECPFDK
jgi:hypothetical protein